MAYETPKMALADMQGCYVGSTPARRWYDGGTLVYQGFSPASEQEFIQQTAAGGPAQLLKVYGKSIVWNQLSNPSTTGGNGITITNNGDGTYTLNGTVSRSVNLMISYCSVVSGHKYLLNASILSRGSGTSLQGVLGQVYGAGLLNLAAYDSKQQLIGQATGTGGSVEIRWHFTSGDIYDNVRVVLRLFDLTLLYGAGHEPTTVAQFLADYPEYNPAYDPGSLQSNKTSELRAYNGGTLRGSLALNLSTLTGKLNGEGASVVVCPEGLMQAGSVRDEAIVENGYLTKIVKRITRVDLSTLPWANISSPSSHIFRVYRTDLAEAIKPPINDNSLANASVLGYTQKSFSPITSADDMCFAVGHSDRIVFINHACSTIAQFEAAVSGLYMYYELATPQTYTLDTPLPTGLTCVQGDILQRVSDNNCPFVGEMKFGL